jgi:hypothetical protein
MLFDRQETGPQERRVGCRDRADLMTFSIKKRSVGSPPVFDDAPPEASRDVPFTKISP